MVCRFLIFEEQLYDGKSHHLAYYSSILAAARPDETEVVLYANTEAEEFVCQRLNAIPAMWTMAGLAASGPWRVQNKLQRALLLAKHLCKNFLVCTSAVNQHKPDVVLCLSTWIPHVLLFLLVALRLGRSMPNLVLLFVWYPRIGKAKLRSFRLVRFLLRWLLKVHPRTYVFAETRYARRAWEEFLEVPVNYVVHPVMPAERHVAPEDRRSEIDDKQGAGSREQGADGKAESGNAEKLKREGTTNHTNLHERGEAGPCSDKPSGAAFSNSFTSEIARDCEITSLTRSASGPALAAEPPRTDGGGLMADGSKLFPSSATGKALDAGGSTLDASSPATSYPPLATSASPIVFGFYGFARHEQGVDVLMRALEILKDKRELDAEFRIVWPKAFQMPDGAWMDREMFAHLGANVRFFENPLSPADYLRELLETDWLILPYRVASYEGRCSRISIEACVMGIPVIYTKGTDLEEVVRSHGEGIGVPEEDAGALASAIRLAVQENRAFQQKALSKLAPAKLYFSGRSFLEAISGKN